MQRIEFSELTNRLRRNLMGAAFLIVVIAGFDIRVGKASASGLDLENLTTEVVLAVLLALLIYHAVTFGFHAFEEYRLWGLKPEDKLASISGGRGFLELNGPMTGTRRALNQIKEIVKERGQQEDFTKEQYDSLEEVIEGALVYAKRLQSFPVITRVRFWALDIGIAVVMTLVATLFSFSVLPAGILSRWLL